MKAFIVALLSAAFLLAGSTWFNNNYASNYCSAGEISSSVVEPKAKDPLMFNWGSSKPNTYDKFPGFQSNILSGLGEGKILEITGRYYEGEEAPAGSDKEKIPLPTGDEKPTEFTSALFNWVDAPTEERKVIKTPDGDIIYFDFNVAQKKVNRQVDEYLQEVAAYLKATPTSKVEITGHTDFKGTEENNQVLGMRRAKDVRDILVGLGVSGSRIITLSKGETQPADPRTTDQARANNRRAVLRIIK